MRNESNSQWVSWNESAKTYAITDEDTAHRMLAIGNPYGFNRTGRIGSMKLLKRNLAKRGFTPAQ